MLTKKIKPNFKILGPRLGQNIQIVASTLSKLNNHQIARFEKDGFYKIDGSIIIQISEVEIVTSDIPGYVVGTQENITVALDVNISEKLREEGLAREFINRVQALRKEQNLEVTDKINLEVVKNQKLQSAINNNLTYICDEVLAKNLNFVHKSTSQLTTVNLCDSVNAQVRIKKIK